MERLIVFLDLLGFSRQVLDNENKAYEKICGIRDILRQRINDTKKITKVAPNEYAGFENNVKQHGISEINIQTFSDSIFISSKSGDIGTDLIQVCTLLASAFMDLNKNRAGDKSNDYPILFRGGMDYGNVYELSDFDTELEGAKIKSFFGKAYVNAVKLESTKRGKRSEGARILCTESVKNKFYESSVCQENNLEKLIMETHPGFYEVIWTYYLYEVGQSTQRERLHENIESHIDKVFNIAECLYINYMDTEFVGKYRELLQLVLLGAFLYIEINGLENKEYYKLRKCVEKYEKLLNSPTNKLSIYNYDYKWLKPDR